MSDDHKRVFADGNSFYVMGTFDDEMRDGLVWSLTRKIDNLRGTKDACITVYINSPGGSRFLRVHLTSLFELAKRHGITVRTVVVGHAYSAGSALAIAGSLGERYIDPGSEHLIHHGTFDGLYKTTPEQIDRTSAFYKRYVQATLDHYGKYANIPNLEEHLRDDDFYVPAAKCIKWGLADKYIEDLMLV